MVNAIMVRTAVCAVKALVEAKKAELAKGGKIFVGPLKDQNGVEKVAKDKALDDKELGGLSWLVEGVEGSL